MNIVSPNILSQFSCPFGIASPLCSHVSMLQIMSYNEQIIANADCICHIDEADRPPLPLHHHCLIRPVIICVL